MTLANLHFQTHRARRIRFALQARSLRSGILVARDLTSEPGGFVDWQLFQAAYLRTRVRWAVQRHNAALRESLERASRPEWPFG